LFGGETGDAVDKFAECAWSEGTDGVPLLDGVTTRFVGHKVAVHDFGGDHVCVVLEPISVEVGPMADVIRLTDERDLDPGHPA
jgi:flavin reductase (DIM6/NTAB) family NADH-FMN oxidoreductase RutF